MMRLVAFALAIIKVPSMVFFLAGLLNAYAKPIDEVPSLVHVVAFLEWIHTCAVLFRISFPFNFVNIDTIFVLPFFKHLFHFILFLFHALKF